MFNMNIPHLKKGQKVQEWRPLYAAATATYKDAEAIKFLPIVVDRSPADQKWATAATKQATLKEALDELESRLDGRKTRFVAMKDFFNLKPTATVSLETLETFFFQALEAGKAAEISNDVIAIKFLEFVPGATKLFNDNKAHIKTDMTEDQLIAFFDTVRAKLATLNPKDEPRAVKEEVFQLNTAESSEAEEVLPKWAEELKSQVFALTKTFKARNAATFTSTDSSMDESYMVDKEKDRTSKGPCPICKKQGHSKKTCYRRVCGRCSGKGHDEDMCASRGPRKGHSNKGAQKSR